MTLGHILRQYGEAYRQRYPASAALTRTLQALADCRTPALGGQVTRCQDCGDVSYKYHSCGNRHCPQCGGRKRADWLARRAGEVLPVPYFHVVFTLPHQLSALVLGHRQLLYGLLFDAASRTLLEVAADPKHLGARIGVLAVLHTWGQQLEHHPHLHCVVPGGGLTPAGDWRSCRPNFFLPVKVLGRVFRGKFLAGLKQAYDRGELSFAGSTAPLSTPGAFRNLMNQLYAMDWVVYAKEPFGGPEQVLKYLTGYTHRVALSNRRLVKLENDRVTFTWKNYAQNCQRREMTLEAVEFVRRFALHVLPRGLVRIRHYGLLAHRDRGERLAHCRSLLAAEASSRQPSPADSERRSDMLPRPTLDPRVSLLLFLLGLVAAGMLAAEVVDRMIAVGSAIEAGRVCGLCGGPRECLWQAERPRAVDGCPTFAWDTS